MESYLDVWFVNVGHGDCTIIRHSDGRVTVVDLCASTVLDGETLLESLVRESQANWCREIAEAGGAFGQLAARAARASRLEDRLEDPIPLIRRLTEAGSFHRLVITHPELDHLGELARLFEPPALLPANLWDTAHQRPTPPFKSSQDRDDWRAYEYLRSRVERPRVLRLFRGDIGEWSRDSIEILAPTREQARTASARGDWNGLSYVLRLRHGRASVLLPGDATKSTLQALARTDGPRLRSSILKAPHHGRESGYCADFIQCVNPDYTIVSVGKKPETDASNKYRHHCRRTISTRFEGTIRARLFWNGRVELRNREGARLDDQYNIDLIGGFLARLGRS